MANQALTVSEITTQVKTVLEESLPMMWIIGEVSDFTRASSGHCYWTLRDEASQISCVMFRFSAQKLTFDPEPGMQLLIYGNVSVYERGGRYQFYVHQVQPVGVGEMAIAFERLCERLEAEGLFSHERKRPMPRFPRSIGIVTSGSGAALKDILQVSSRRAPGIQIVLRSTRVQGPGAAENIASAIRDLNIHSGAEILIVGRGGGSPEDLWAFNEEVVARAIYASDIPVVSAVGHEIDNTIADYVADLRAPTPSAAAELVTPDQVDLRRRVATCNQALVRGIRSRIEENEKQLKNYGVDRLLEGLLGRLQQSSQDLDEMRTSFLSSFDNHLSDIKINLKQSSLKLKASDPLAGLSRGFAFCTRADGSQVTNSSDLVLGDQLILRFSEGNATCIVKTINNLDPPLKTSLNSKGN